MVQYNLNKVKENIKRAAERAGRSCGDIRLICVTKEANSSQILDALSNSVKELGENRVKDAVLKHRAIGDNANWHLIGHLQTNKVRDAVKMFSLIHSLDSLKLARRVDKESKKIDKIQDALIEVNISGEKTKFGIKPDDLAGFLDGIKDLDSLKVTGLMTMAPFSRLPEDSRRYYSGLRELRDKFRLKELSMGMTQDYEVAVEEGTTMVRIGRAIFKR